MKIITKLYLACLVTLGANNVQAQISMSIQELDDACFEIIATTPTPMAHIQIIGTPNGTISIEATNTNICQGTLCFTDTPRDPFTIGGFDPEPAQPGASVTVTCSAISLDGRTRLQDGCIVVIGPLSEDPKEGG